MYKKLFIILVWFFIPTLALGALYTVQPGDTLSKIAREQGVDWRTISGFSSGNPDLIHTGEQLTIPSFTFGAVTSTIVQNLFIKGIKPPSGTSTLSIDSNGLVSTTTITGGSSSATTTINGISGPTFNILGANGITISSSSNNVTVTDLASSTWLKVANNGSDINTTSTFRTNLGLGSIATFLSSDYLTSSTIKVTTFGGISGAVLYATSGPGLSISTSSQTVTFTMSTSSFNLGNLSIVNSPLPVANGGTATTTAPTDSQILSASSTSPAWKNLSAGTGITISTSTSALTVTNAGVTSANSITGAAIWAATGPGLSVASSSQTITYTFTSSTLNLGNLSLQNSPLGWTNGGTGTTTSWTAGSVIWANGGTFNQNNANFFWSSSTARLGLGTNSPSTTLHVVGTFQVSATSTLVGQVAVGSSTAPTVALDVTGAVKVSATSTFAGNINASGTLTVTGNSVFQGTLKDGNANAYVTSSDNYLTAIRSAGSVMVGQTVGITLHSIVNGLTAALASGTARFIGVYLPTPQTLTGIKWFESVQGNYTGASSSMVGLYTYSAGNLTMVASSTDDVTLWKTAANTMGSKAFASTYVAAAGIYWVGILYVSSVQTTAPTIYTQQVGTAAMNQLDMTNSATLHGTLAGRTSLPATTTMSALTNVNTLPWIGLY